MGSNWNPPVLSPGLGVSLLMQTSVGGWREAPAPPRRLRQPATDNRQPRFQLTTRLYAGRHEVGTVNGGLFLSNDAGATFANIGLLDVTVSGIALNGNTSKIYAATYGSGI